MLPFAIISTTFLQHILYNLFLFAYVMPLTPFGVYYILVSPFCYRLYYSLSRCHRLHVTLFFRSPPCVGFLTVHAACTTSPFPLALCSFSFRWHSSDVRQNKQEIKSQHIKTNKKLRASIYHSENDIKKACQACVRCQHLPAS